MVSSISSKESLVNPKIKKRLKRQSPLIEWVSSIISEDSLVNPKIKKRLKRQSPLIEWVSSIISEDSLVDPKIKKRLKRQSPLIEGVWAFFSAEAMFQFFKNNSKEILKKLHLLHWVGFEYFFSEGSWVTFFGNISEDFLNHVNGPMCLPKTGNNRGPSGGALENFWVCLRESYNRSTTVNPLKGPTTGLPQQR